MRISEIFYSLQGEGLYQGEPTVFIRLQGCNLHCSWCDTAYAQDVNGGYEATVDEVVEQVESYQRGGWVCITGGEPLRQEDEVSKLAAQLWGLDYMIEIETNGFYPLPYWHSRIHSWALDVKCPSSKNLPLLPILKTWEELTSSNLQVKFVVQDIKDLAYVLLMQKKKLFNHKRYIVSPVFTKGELNGKWGQDVAQFCIENNCRLSLQYHKILWGDTIGV